VRLSLSSLLVSACCIGFSIWPSCAPMPPMEEDQQQQKEEEERYRVRIAYDPIAPQAIRGFLHLGQVYSVTMGSVGVGVGAGSPRDLDLIIDALNEFTDIETSFTSSMTYSDPRLLDLPIIIPQSEPNEVEMERLVSYLLDGGFVLDLDIGFDAYRQGLSKYGGLLWGDDVWVEHLEADHPIFSSFFDVGGGTPQSNQRVSQRRWGNDQLRGLFIGERLVGVRFGVREPAINTDPGALPPGTRLSEEEIIGRNTGSDEVRRQQMAVNIVVFALTQEGSIGHRLMRAGGAAGE